MRTFPQLRKLRQPLAAATLSGVLAVVTVVGVYIGSAPAAPKPAAPPQPIITAGPTGTVATTSATFSYQDSQAGVTFQCALDSSSFAACGSTKTYSGLAAGSHTFRVAANVGNGPSSSAATRTWTVDTTPPQISTSFPKVNPPYNAAAWTAGCPIAPGMCGTATDPSGVAAVQIAVVQVATGRYWNGSAFVASGSPLFQSAIGTTSWRYAMGRPADGLYTLLVRATDGLGNATPLGGLLASAFIVDTQPPPAPAFSKTPDTATNAVDAEFQFSDALSTASFNCALDSASLAGCSSPVKLKKLALGDHCFVVVAVDPALNESPPAQFCWTIVSNSQIGISGTLDQTLAPGVSRRLNLTFANPQNFAIKVLSVSISVNPTTKKNGVANNACSGTQNLVVSQGLIAPIIVPANGSKTLAALGVPQAQWPLLTMPNLASNQDSCKNTTFSLTYTGTATKP